MKKGNANGWGETITLMIGWLAMVVVVAAHAADPWATFLAGLLWAPLILGLPAYHAVRYFANYLHPAPSESTEIQTPRRSTPAIVPITKRVIQYNSNGHSSGGLVIPVTDPDEADRIQAALDFLDLGQHLGAWTIAAMTPDYMSDPAWRVVVKMLKGARLLNPNGPTRPMPDYRGARALARAGRPLPHPDEGDPWPVEIRLPQHTHHSTT